MGMRVGGLLKEGILLWRVGLQNSLDGRMGVTKRVVAALGSKWDWSSVTLLYEKCWTTCIHIFEKGEMVIGA